MIPTAHIEATDTHDIAPIVIMPGDPKRAKFIANNFLTDVIEVNSVRNMLGYTGTYKDRRITVFGSGMGMPSIGIYSFELFQFYGVEKIVRIGSCGSYKKDIALYDLVIVKDAWSESSFAKTACNYEEEIILPSPSLTGTLSNIADDFGLEYRYARVHSSDVFYRLNKDDYKQIRDEHGCEVVEMEAFALFANAKMLNKHAACILTVSDNLETGDVTSAEERQNAFTNMMKIALELAE